MSQKVSKSKMHKQIEDVIETLNQQGNMRYIYSTPGSSLTDDLRDNVSNFDSPNSGNNSIGPTDSEITLCRVKRENSHVKKIKENNWDVMHDSAIPGDGTHLGESPSLVNLVTLVMSNEPEQKRRGHGHGQCFEYLVPLSSWEPTHNDDDNGSYESAEHLSNEELASGGTGRTRQTECNGNYVQKRLSLTRDSLNSLASCSKSVEKQKSTASMKDLFKRMVFWKRRSREQLDGKDSNTDNGNN